jgi:uncharacterized membrane protein YozB (DUF420 family)
MKVDVLKRMIFYAGAIAAILSYADSWQNRAGAIGSLVIMLITTLPFLILIMWTIKGTKKYIYVKYIAAGVCCIVGVFAYAAYLIGGPSNNQDTAGHMHIIFFPVLHLLFTLCVVAGSIMLMFILNKMKNEKDT